MKSSWPTWVFFDDDFPLKCMYDICYLANAHPHHWSSKKLILKIIKEMLECSAFTCPLLPSEELNDVQQMTHGEKVLVRGHTWQASLKATHALYSLQGLKMCFQNELFWPLDPCKWWWCHLSVWAMDEGNIDNDPQTSTMW
jgi:hypothetical protein